MSDATDINSLPTNPIAGSSETLPNIVMHKNEIMDNKLGQLTQAREQELKNIENVPTNLNSQQGMPSALDQNIINKLISGIQQASASGLTSLPSSHIPLDTNTFTRDVQIKPNYIPNNNNELDYIQNITTKDDILRTHMRAQNKSDTLDVMYDELQIPILIAIIYFAFQLPIVRKNLFSYFPSLFNKDGNPKLSGYVFNSVMFALIFYIIKKSLNFLTDI
jgi:hypothetical protein